MTPQPTDQERDWMRQALALAARGRGFVEPNPMVGCVIVRAGRIIGQGYHQRFGQAHAEPNALASCTEDPRGATAIVTLEPCCHTNKKTPPCVPALVAAGVARVVVGHTDPNPLVSGGGIAQLRAAGIEVMSDVLADECRQLNAPFFALTRFARPYVTLKWAQSADGLMGGRGNTPRRISGPESTRLVHMLRTRCDAIAVSADTVIADDPLLTPRDVPIIRIPLRIILDAQLRTPRAARLLVSSDGPTVVFTAASDGQIAGWKSQIPGLQSEFVPAPLLHGHLDLRAVLQTLGERRITHLLIEPGPRLARAFIEQNLVDRIWVIRSPNRLDEPDAPVAPTVPYRVTLSRQLGQDTLTEYLNPASDVFFASIPSPESQL
jgi:diaminohydroxyphosphoribosylaminopyrimidine deaminase/5-amino-6-(5-phosphoribosylamino)uracil reductase